MLVVASTRPGRLGPAVATWFQQAVATVPGADLEIADLAAVGLPFLDEPLHPSTGIYHHEHTRRWSRLVDSADGFVFVTPEYNFGMPATLKNAFDHLSREWAWKPCLFVGYGNTSAGTRGVQMAREVAANLRMPAIGGDIYLRIADDVANGAVIDTERRTAHARHAFTQLIRTAGILRPLRTEDGQITRATYADAAELTVLQRACWVDEAIANQTLDLPALHESLEQVSSGLDDWTVWVIRAGGRLVASARARREGDAWQIGRLMVAPDHRHRGLGRQLLAHAEQAAPPGTQTITLSTGAHSSRNQALYRQAGYELTADGPAGTVSLRKAHAS
ncbi:bifunctional NAD(P)H-dependent oxidoreductase/GNAT family N-acetyltransferase [Kribbella sandramycini]